MNIGMKLIIAEFITKSLKGKRLKLINSSIKWTKVPRAGKNRNNNGEDKPSSVLPLNQPLLSHTPCIVPSTSLALHFLLYSSVATCSLQIEITHLQNHHKFTIISASQYHDHLFRTIPSMFLRQAKFRPELMGYKVSSISGKHIKNP